MLPSTSFAASGQAWVNHERMSLAAATGLLIILVVYHVHKCIRDRDTFIRRLEPLEYLNRCMGAAAELGRGVFFLPGLAAISEPSTISSISVLSTVARSALRHRVKISVPCADPVVQAVAANIIDEASASMEQQADGDMAAVFISNRPFAYAAGTVGLFSRQNPAAIFYFGTFFAESLILAESGGAEGAMQVAATDSVTQAPFFIASCDSVLVGEELYAAGASLSRNPAQVGALKAQDVFKAVVAGLIILGLAGSVTGLFDIASLVGGN